MTEIVDNRTANYSILQPDLANYQEDDIIRIIGAFALIDALLKQISDTAAAKAPASHGHEIVDVTGLSDALAGKLAASWRPALDELTDVDVAAGANGQYLKKVGSNWIAANVQLGDVTGFQDTVNALIDDAISNLVNGSPAALDTLQELAAALGNDPAFANTMATAMGNRLRFDAAQVLTGPQKAQGLTNLGVSAAAQALLVLADAASIFASIKQGASDAATGVVELATPTEAAAGADTSRAVTPAGVAAAIAALTPPGLGVGQTWYYPSRSIGTNYQNLTGRSIEVNVTVTTTAGGSFGLQISNDGTLWYSIASVGVPSITAAMSMVVPNNAYYRVIGEGGSIYIWSELSGYYG